MAGVSALIEMTIGLRARDDRANGEICRKVMTMGAMDRLTTTMASVQAPHGSYDALAPTRWWRWAGSSLFEADALSEMKATVAKMPLPISSRWRSAAAGDASAAIGLVLGADLRRMDCRKLDLAMTMLAICALEGNDAACVVLSHAIRRIPGAGPHEARVATSWLVHAFGKALSADAGRRPKRKDGGR